MPSVVSFGSVNVDHVVRVDDETLAALRERYDWFPDAGETVAVDSFPGEFADLDARHLPGGKGANQAVAASRAGADAALLGAVGTDEGEYGVLDALAGYGVDVSGVETVDAPTGAASVFVDDSGENRIAVTAGANGEVDPEYAARHREAVLAADVLLLQNELPVEAVDALLSTLDGAADRPTVVLDPAPADGAARLVGHRCVDVITPNEHEAATLREVLDGFQGTVVETRGADPVVVAGEQHFEVTPPAVDPVDTTGAGDVFAGFLAARLAAGDTLRAAVEVAAAAGALSVTGEGVQQSTPSAEAVAAF